MQNIINEQEIVILELNHIKSNTAKELEELKTQVGFKSDQLREWKQKYEVKFLFYQYINIVYNIHIMCFL